MCNNNNYYYYYYTFWLFVKFEMSIIFRKGEDIKYFNIFLVYFTKSSWIIALV